MGSAEVPEGNEPQSRLATAVDVREYFHDQLTQAITRQHADVDQAAEAYVVNLLATFVTSEQLFVRDQDGAVDREPLALMLKRAVDAPREERVRHLRRMGDTALYVSGFFADRIGREPVDVAYYAAMGGRAYDAVSGLSRGEEVARVFRELATKFARFVELLNEISERAMVQTNAGMLRVYERYARTGSGRLRGLLAEQGVLTMALPGMEQ